MNHDEARRHLRGGRRRPVRGDVLRRSGIDAAAQAEKENLDGRGPITYVQGKDNSNVVRPLIDEWNATHPGEEVTFKEQSDQADQQHEDLVQHFQSRDSGYDVTVVDVVWTAEFAARGWLQPLEGPMAIDTSGLLPATVEGATYGDVLYAAPQTSDGALLYYRTDLMDHPPPPGTSSSARAGRRGSPESAATPDSTPSMRG